MSPAPRISSGEGETLELVAEHVQARLQVDGLGFARGRTGLDPVSAGGQFVVGPYQADENVIAVGGRRHAGICSGVSLGPVAAEWAVFGEARSFPAAAALEPDRYSIRSDALAELPTFDD